jgi:hypothetical protein
MLCRLTDKTYRYKTRISLKPFGGQNLAGKNPMGWASIDYSTVAQPVLQQ